MGTAFRAFEAGELDVAVPATGQRKQAEATYGPKGGFVSKVPYSLSYLRPNMAKGLLAEADARRAVSMALDREAISQAIGEGYWEPATALIPPPFGSLHQPGVCDACRFDPARAKELAARSGLTPGTRLRYLAATGAATNPLGQAIKDQLEKNLGIVVDLQNFPLAEAVAKQAAGEFDLSGFSWGADYPTADNFLFPLLGRGSAENSGGYDNAEFNNLIQQARTQRGDAERKRLYQSAERLAIGQDVALIPGWYIKSLVVFDAQKWTPITLDFFAHVNYDTLSLK
jgi:oligopeptide transport system substrate-binding protein